MTAWMNKAAAREILAEVEASERSEHALDRIATAHGMTLRELNDLVATAKGQRGGTSSVKVVGSGRPRTPRATDAPSPRPEPVVEQPEPSKVCSLCKESKPLSEFYSDPQMKDGRQNHCRTCNNDRPVTPSKLVRNRALSRATAALKKLHPEDFKRLYEVELEAARKEHERLVAAAEGQHDAATARLKPGPKRADETDALDRLDVARCPSCHRHHDEDHVCPNCGDETPDQPAPVKPYEIRFWAVRQGLAPIPERGPLPARITAAFYDAHPDRKPNEGDAA